MGQVRAVTSRSVAAPAQRVFDAVADYAQVRPQVLPGQFSGFAVREGGVGAGTVAAWTLAATEKRVRQVLVTVSSPGELSLVETDANSSMVSTWTVSGAADGASSTVALETVWNGAGGIGGFFEKTFAPKALARIYDELLGNLAAYVEGGQGASS